MVLNVAARLVVGAIKCEHITLVSSLRRASSATSRLPLRQWILFKVAVVAFNCIRAAGPVWFKDDVCTPVVEITGPAHLRSAQRRDMLRTRTRCNSLPTHLRSASISRGQFRDGLTSLKQAGPSPYSLVKLSIHHCHHYHFQHQLLIYSFTPGANPTFSTNPSHLNRFLVPPGLPSRIIGLDRTYHARRFILSSYFI